MPDYTPIFFSSADNLSIPVPVSVFADGDTVLSLAHGTPKPTDIFLWGDRSAAVRGSVDAVHNDANGLQIGNTERAEMHWGLLHVQVPATAEETILTAKNGFAVVASRQLRRLRQLDFALDFKGSQMNLADKITRTQENKAWNSQSPQSLVLKMAIKNHPSPADAEFLRDVSQSGQSVWVWPCGGFIPPVSANEQAPYMQYDVLRLMVCTRRQFDSYKSSYVLGLDGRMEFSEAVEETTAFTLPRAGQRLCYVDPDLGGICFVDPNLGDVLTV